MTNPTFTLDSTTINDMIEKAVEDHILSAIESLTQDPAWLEKIERLINQTTVQRTVSKLASTDIRSIICEHLDQNMHIVQQHITQNFTTNGIADRATTCQLTVMDEDTVVENRLVAKNLHVMDTTVIKDLTVTGSINTDNRSWHDLAQAIGQRTLDQIDQSWQQNLVAQVTEQIREKGIDFADVMVQGEKLVSGNSLSNGITETNIQRLGHLRELRVKGEAHIYDTVTVVNRRLGVNTATPESALSIWDEEVAVIIGKHKSKQAFIGTSRDQSLALGVNREPQIEIDSNGLTRVKKLQIGLHKISHDVQVPGWPGTRGDLVFNSNPGPDRVFAWVCLGSHKWQSLKSAE